MILTDAIDPAPLGAIFAIPADDWTLINKRVGLATLAGTIAGAIGPFLPAFDPFASGCTTWSQSTFPGLTSQADALAAFAPLAIQKFGLLGDMVSSLDPAAPLPPSVVFDASVTFGAVGSVARSIHDRFAALTTALSAFAGANDRIDSELESVVAVLGPGWRAVGATISKVDAAFGAVLGAWRALSDDLSALVSGQAPITIALIESLTVASAMSGWRNLQAEASAFPSLANGQQIYLSGQWLN